MVDILLRGLFLAGGIAIAVVLIGVGLFFGWIFFQRDSTPVGGTIGSLCKIFTV
jgi:hypothetical protein